MGLKIWADGEHSTVDFLRVRMIAAVEEVADEWNEDHPDDTVDVGWEWED